MNQVIQSIQRKKGLQGKIEVPGDKSISHRALILGGIAQGVTEIENLLLGEDVLSTQGVLKSLGCNIRQEESQGRSIVKIQGKGFLGLRQTLDSLDCGNSGTTLRLMMGVLAGQPFESVLTGDASLKRRPMKRVAEPLSQMGARIELTQGNQAPIRILGTRSLKSLFYELPIASAQLKSALLLAGLNAEGKTELTGQIQSRDHTERMLPHFGATLEVNAKKITLNGFQNSGHDLHAASVKVPGDFSSAAFWIGAALLVPGSRIEINEVSLNPTRIGLLEVLKRMGAKIEMEITQRLPEPIGSLQIEAQSLRATSIEPREVSFLIDEIPLFAILATQAEGLTEVRGASELRVKEADRIEAIAMNLRAMGVDLETFSDGFRIQGPQDLKGAKIQTLDDHRIAMAFSIAGLIAHGDTIIEGANCVRISYPQFYKTLQCLSEK